MKNAYFLKDIVILIFVSLFFFGCEAKVLEFADVYVLRDGKYIEVI